MRYLVEAGKYDDYSKNCKYSNEAETLDKAKQLVEELQLNQYPWYLIEDTETGETFTI